jgi:hypothetical protein
LLLLLLLLGLECGESLLLRETTEAGHRLGLVSG